MVSENSHASSDFTEIFSRNLVTLSADQQRLLLQKKVAVVGCGGLGGFVIEQLVRLGIGTLHCFDPDVFTASNCNRQLGARMSTLGRNKAVAIGERAVSIHPFATVVPYSADFRDVADSEAFAVDLVVDCLDDIDARFELATLCARHALFLVLGGVHGWCGQVGVLPPGGKLLHKLYPRSSAEETVLRTPSVLSCTVACTASVQVAEVVKNLLGFSTELLDHALFLDLQHLEFMTFA